MDVSAARLVGGQAARVRAQARERARVQVVCVTGCPFVDLEKRAIEWTTYRESFMVLATAEPVRKFFGGRVWLIEHHDFSGLRKVGLPQRGGGLVCL